MDKRVILAVAGSGKTTYIINQLDLNKRSLIITYTTNNIENLRTGVIKKFGYFLILIKDISILWCKYFFQFYTYFSSEGRIFKPSTWSVLSHKRGMEEAKFGVLLLVCLVNQNWLLFT